MDIETPGNRIRAARDKLGITPAKLASLVRLNERTINRVEVGITPIAIIADYLHLIAAELGTTEAALLHGELPSERATRAELQRMRNEGVVQSEDELETLFGLATDSIRKRSNANIPLSRQDLLNLIEVIRGADGLQAR